MQHSNDSTKAKAKVLGTVANKQRETPDATSQVFFRIDAELDIQIRHAMADRRCSRRELWLLAMNEFLARNAAAKTAGSQEGGI